MKKKLVAAILCMTLTICFPQAVLGEASEINGIKINESSYFDKEREYVEGELFVAFRDGVSEKKAEKVIKKEDLSCEKNIDAGESGEVKLVGLSDGMSVEEGLEKLSEEDSVEYVQPNYIYHASGEEDYGYLHYEEGYGYHFRNSSIAGAWNLLEKSGYKKHKAKVAVIDSELFTQHEDISGVKRYTVVGNTNNKSELITKSTHGTHVTGIVGAVYGNSKGIAGAASGYDNSLCEIMFIAASVSKSGNDFTTESMIDAIDLAAQKGAEIVNMSITGSGRDPLLEDVITDKFDNEGMMFVAASGNSRTDGDVNPADMREVIAVNSADENGKKVSSSNYGILKDVSADGEGVVSTLPYGNAGTYGAMSGTSMAAPIVTGTLAMILDANPDLSQSEAYNILCASAENDGVFEEKGTAYGVIDAEAAVQAAHDASAAIKPDKFALKDYTYELYDISEEDWLVHDGISVFEGDTFGLETLRYPARVITPVTWRSKDEKIAVVDNEGRVTGISPGETVVTGTCGGKTVKCTVAVLGEADVDISSSKRKMLAGEKYRFRASVKDRNGTGYADIQSVKWTCKNSRGYENVSDVAKVDEYTGKVTALREGRTDLTLKVRVREFDPYSDVACYNTYEYKSTVTITIGRENYSGKDYGLKVSKTTKKAAVLKWKDIPVADKFVVYRATSKNGKYKKLGTLSAGSVGAKNSGLKKNKKYYYRIRAKYGSRYFGYSSKVCAKTKK